MKGCGLKEAARRTGLTRRQLRYLEERGHLGFVARSDGRTVYAPEQVTLLEHIARLRALGASLDEAAQIAAELVGRTGGVSDARIDELAHTAFANVERSSRAAADLVGLRERRRAALAG